MGNKSSKKNENLAYSLSIEFFGDKFNQRQSITGQVVMTFNRDYESPGGLDSAEITL